MQYREDKLNGNQLSALGFGCMRFPSRAGRIIGEKTEPLLLEAYERGVNYFDTAYLYNKSEEFVGEVFERHGIRKNLFLATKLPHALCQGKEDLDRIFGVELERLRTDYIDYYLIHNLSELVQWERLCQLGIEEWIAQKKEQGAIRRIGFSFHGTYPEFVRLLDAYDFEFTQIQYNYLNEHYQAGIQGLRYAAGKGLPVMVMEPLLGGKLADSVPQAAAALMEKAQPGSTPVSWAFKWVWNHPEATVLLSGMNEPEQLEENLKLADTALPDSMTSDELAVIKEVVDIFTDSYKVLCTGCNYCMPCPKDINIPGILAALNTSYSIGRFAGISQYMTNIGIASGVPRLASSCINCGACRERCPQNLEIPELMAQAKSRLQPPGMAALAPHVMKVIGRVMR